MTDVDVNIDNDNGDDWLIPSISFAIAQRQGLVLVEEDTNSTSETDGNFHDVVRSCH